MFIERVRSRYFIIMDICEYELRACCGYFADMVEQYVYRFFG